MERDSSDSSSWSLVNVTDSDATDASDIDSIGDDLIMESVHDSDSEYDSSEDDEVEHLSEAEEATEESEVEEALKSEAIEDHLEEALNEEEEVLEEGGHQADYEDDSEAEVVEEEEALAEAAAKHFVEPAKVATKFEELSKTMDSPFDRLFENITTNDSGIIIIAICMLVSVVGAGLGHYVGACLAGTQPLARIEGPFCFESERMTSLPSFVLQQHSGLQYQDVVQSTPVEEASSLQQCKESLQDAQAEVKMKSGVNRFVRENYKRQLQKAKADFEARLVAYKKASRRLLASKYSESQKKSQSKPDYRNENDATCKFNERPFLNLTRSIFSSVSNWTSHNQIVKNILNFSPNFDKSLEKVSSWLRKSNNFSQNIYQSFHSLTKVPKLPKALNDVPKKAWSFLRSDLRSYAKKVTTALSRTNLSTKLEEYKKIPFVQKFQKRVESALSRLSELKTHAEVCFAKKTCDASLKLAKHLESVPELSSLIGKKRAKEYIQYLSSLSSKNCSMQMNCEKDWWTGCGLQFLKNCELQKWQSKRVFSGAALINRSPKMKEAAMDLGWIAPKEKRTSIRCGHLSASPLPCPSTNALPTLPQEPLAPCHSGPNSARPCPTSPATPPRPCPASNRPCKAFSKPVDLTGRPDWFSERAAARAHHRQSHSAELSSSRSATKTLHLKNRRKQHA